MNTNKMLKKMLGSSGKRKNDWDGDGVSNKKDCQPRNPMRQDRLIPTGWVRHKEKQEKENENKVKGSEVGSPPWTIIAARRRQKQQEEAYEDDVVDDMNRMFPVEE